MIFVMSTHIKVTGHGLGDLGLIPIRGRGSFVLPCSTFISIRFHGLFSYG
jgi:hypothetical protein